MNQNATRDGRESGSPGEFTLNDFREQLDAIASMGMEGLISRLPGISDMIPEGEDPEATLARVRGMLDSMTAEERADPSIIDRHRLRRIAAGAGVRPQEIEQFLGQFGRVRARMRQMASMSLWERIKMIMGIGKHF